MGSYDLEKRVLLPLMCSYKSVVLKIKGDYSVGSVTVVMQQVLDLYSL